MREVSSLNHRYCACRVDDPEDLPFIYSFDTQDVYTNWTRMLPLPIGNRIPAVQLLYDTDTPQQMPTRRVERGVRIVGTVADRLGSSAELCDRASLSSCYKVTLEPFQGIQSNMINTINDQFNDNKISITEAVSRMSTAVKLRAGQKDEQSPTEEQKTPKEETAENLQILSLLATAASDLTEQDTPRTNRFRNQIMQVASSTLTDANTTNLTVATDVLQVTHLTLRNMNVTGGLRETDELVDSVVEVFGSATRVLADPLDDDRSEEQETRNSLRETLALHVDNFCLDLTADSPPGDAAMSSSSQDYHFSCQKAFPRSESNKESQGGTKPDSRMVFMGSQPVADSTGSLPATPPMSVVGEGLQFAALQVVHLQAPGTIANIAEPPRTSVGARDLELPSLQLADLHAVGTTADVAEVDRGATANRRSINSCNALPVSELRLLMSERLADTTKVLIKQRVDITAKALGCKKYQIRQGIGQLRLPNGLGPGALLHNIKFDGTGVIQKFYTAAVEFGDAVLLSEGTTYIGGARDVVPEVSRDVQINSRKSGSLAATRRSKVVAASVKLVEQPLPTDYALSYNSIMDLTGHYDFYRLSLACWVTIIVVVSMLFIFGVLIIVQAGCLANRADMRDEQREHLQNVYLIEGGIDIFAFPKTVGERLGCGMGLCGAHNCWSALNLCRLVC